MSGTNRWKVGAAFAGALLAGCEQREVFPLSVHVDAGWHYGYDLYRNHVAYGFGDASGSFFAGTCDRYPIFMLLQRDYGDDVKKFVVTIDRQSWTLDAYRGEHGQGLLIDDPGFADRFAKAKSLVRFRADDGWTRAFKPALQLQRLVYECRSMRRTDPGATGWPSPDRYRGSR